VAVAAGVVLDAGDAGALQEALAAALEASREHSAANAALREENALLREQVARLAARDAERDAELERLRADFAVLQRLVFGRSSEKSRPGPPAGGAGTDGGPGGGGKKSVKRGPGARAGRRDYSHLPRFEVSWDFPGGGTAARSAGSRSRPWVTTGPSSWTGR
jgi:transposase